MMKVMEASRPLGQYGDLYPVMYVMALVAVFAAGYGVYRRVRSWMIGRGAIEDRRSNFGRRFLQATGDALWHRRILDKAFVGSFHLFFFWGALFFLTSTILIMVQEKFHLPVFQGLLYLGLNLVNDLFALLILVGTIVLLVRRHTEWRGSLKHDHKDTLALLLIAAVMMTGLFLEGVRLVMEVDPWAMWQPAGFAVSVFLPDFPPTALSNSHRILWMTHMILSMGLLASLPYWKLFHIFAGSAGLLLGNRDAAVALIPTDMEGEDVEVLGAERVEHLNWKQILDTDSCMACGRCEENCPANLAGKSLSPMEVNLGLGRMVREHSGKTKQIQARDLKDSFTEHRRNGEIVPDAVTPESLWACTTCRACETICPVVVEHVPRLVEIRRCEVMMKGDFPLEAQAAFRGMEDNYNPWNLSFKERDKWADEYKVPLASELDTTEYLLWTGCAGIYEQRNRKVLQSLVRILRAAGIEFSVLGSEERCCGDSARRMGHEYLYQSLVHANIQILNQYDVKKIITPCPHCFNTLKNEYTAFGGSWEVIHHSEFIEGLLRNGQLGTSDSVEEFFSTITFHDPCYLGRYNGVYDQPRNVLSTLCEDRVLDLERSREKSFCCGGGGGRMWMEEEPANSVVRERTREIRDIGVDALATACPFCLMMLGDALKEEGDIKVLDIAELAESFLKSEDRHVE